MAVGVSDAGGILSSAADVPGLAGLGTGRGAVSCWIRPRASQFGYWRIFERTKSNGSYGVDCRLADADFDTAQLQLADNSGVFTATEPNPVPVKTRRWVHVGWNFDYSGATPDHTTFVRNGRVRSIGTTTFTTTLPTTGTSVINVLLFGGGALADLQVFAGRELTPAEWWAVYEGRDLRPSGRYYVGGTRGVDLSGHAADLATYTGVTRTAWPDPPARRGRRPRSALVAGTPNNPAQSTATVPASPPVGAPRAITVQARDSNGTNMTVGGATVVVTITGKNPGTPAVTDNGNGTYTCSDSPQTLGADSVAITMGGVAIGGSPYSSVVVGGGVGVLVNGGLVHRG